MSTLTCLSIPTIRALAGERWFARGESYQQQGRVDDLRVNGNRLSASVTGTKTYRVRLSCRSSRIEYFCSCPVGDDGNFCKHCVAVALAWIDEPKTSDPVDSSIKPGSNLRAVVELLDHQKLVDFILEEASSNRHLRERLGFEAARSQSSDPDFSVFRKAITGATRTSGVDYYSMPRFARRLTEVIDSLKPLLGDGHAKAVVELTEYCYKRLEKALGEVDDSDGHFGYILPELGDLHHAACLLAAENPLVIARRLFEWELNSEWEFFLHASASYADVLGPDGLGEYQRLAKEHWAKVAALKPGDDDSQRYGNRFRITSIMETLAIESGDLEAQLAIKKRDLSLPYSFLQIAELYQQAGRHDEALDWAEQGARSFSQIDSRLSDFLAAEYHRRGHHGDAMNLIWQQFLELPRLETYQKLHANALEVKTRDKLHLVVSSGSGVNPKRSSKTSLSLSDGRRSDSGTAVGRARTAAKVDEEDHPEWSYWRENALRFLRERLGIPEISLSSNTLRSPDLDSSTATMTTRIDEEAHSRPTFDQPQDQLLPSQRSPARVSGDFTGVPGASSPATANLLVKGSSAADAMFQISNPWTRQSDHSLLVEIFLWERRHEDAWQEAMAGGCDEQLWHQLAKVMAESHPDRAYRIYEELLPPTIAPTNNQAYSEAIKLLKKMKKLASRLHRQQEFDDYLVALRTQYKPKRNFIKLLDGMRSRLE